VWLEVPITFYSLGCLPAVNPLCTFIVHLLFPTAPLFSFHPSSLKHRYQGFLDREIIETANISHSHELDIIAIIVNDGMVMVRHSSTEIILACSNPPCASSEGRFGGGPQFLAPQRRKINSVRGFFNSETSSRSASTAILPYLVQGDPAFHQTLRYGLTRVLVGISYPFTSYYHFLLMNSFRCSGRESRTHKIPPLMLKYVPCSVKSP